MDNKPHTSALTWSDTAFGGDGRMRFYVDGILQGTTAVNDFGDGIVSNGFAIARGEDYPTETRGFFQGTIGEVRMYDTVENIAALHDELVNDNPNLIGDWNADDYSGSGNWVDRISGLSSAVSGDPSVSAGIIGSTSCTNGIYFDGNDRFDVSAANNPAVGQSKLTVIVSFRTTTGGMNNNADWWTNTGIVGGDAPEFHNDWALMLLQNGDAKSAFDGVYLTDGNIIDGGLHTMAMTWSDPSFGGDAMMRLYVDGVLKATHNGHGQSDIDDGIFNYGFSIAAEQLSGNNFFTGTIGEVRLYSQLKNIQELHTEMTAPHPYPTGTLILIK